MWIDNQQSGIHNPQSSMCLHTVTRVSRQASFNPNKA